MAIDLEGLKRERHDELGWIMERDAQQLADAWLQTAIDQHPGADPSRRTEAYDELPELLREVGRALASAGENGQPQPVAREHGRQRWTVGWSLDDVIRDYEILRPVVLEHLEDELGESLSTREVMALGVALDEALIHSALAYAKGVQKEFDDIRSTLEQKVAEQVGQLRLAASELVRAEQRERRKIASILHDHFQQLLIAARFNAGALRSSASKEKDVETLQALNDLLGEAITASRTLAVELEPPALQQQGLGPALRWLAASMSEQHGLHVTVASTEEVDPADAQLRSVVYHCVRELLLNIVKHAGVSQARIEQSRIGDLVQLVVSDHGAGFDPEGAINGHTFGLPNIKQRLNLMGCSFDVHSSPGDGTRVTLRAPCRP